MAIMLFLSLNGKIILLSYIIASRQDAHFFSNGIVTNTSTFCRILQQRRQQRARAVPSPPASQHYSSDSHDARRASIDPVVPPPSLLATSLTDLQRLLSSTPRFLIQTPARANITPDPYRLRRFSHLFASFSSSSFCNRAWIAREMKSQK